MNPQLALKYPVVVNKGTVQEVIAPTHHNHPPSSADQSSLATLIQFIAAGDQQALAELYDATSPRVYGLAIRILGESAAAEEIAIEVYSQIWTQADTYNAQRGSVLSWILNRTRSRAIDLLRSRKRTTERTAPLEQAGEVPSPAPDPEEISIEAERQRFVRQALDSLQPEQRQVIELAYFSGLSHTEIATTLEQPLGTVKTRIRTGMVRLRDLLTPLASSVVLAKKGDVQ